MKTNLFKVREIKKDKIVVEEEQLKHPILLFFKRHITLLTIFMSIAGVSTVGAGLAITISLVKNTGDFDITYISGSDKITTNDSDEEEVEKELLGDIAIKDGIVLVTKKFITKKGDVVTYYSDGTSLIVTSNGKIKRVVAKDDGSYAIDENGKVDSNTIAKIVTSETNTLDDGTVITYYSDGSAEITKDKLTIFIRDSKNIDFNLYTTNQMFNKVLPSGVSIPKENKKLNSYKYTEFLDGTILIEKDNEKYIVHNKEDVKLTEESFTFPNNNNHTIKNSKTYDDGNTIDYYNDGSAIITDQKGNKVSIRKSGDINIVSNKVFEIYPSKVAYAVSKVNSPDGKVVTYYDNASAIIQKSDNTKEYIEDNSLIKYDISKNISSIPENKSNQNIQKTLPDGTQITSFTNDKVQVIEPNGSDYIVNLEDLKYDISGNIEKPKSSSKTSKVTSSEAINSETSSETTSKTSGSGKGYASGVLPDGDLDMTEAKNEWNYSKSLETSEFKITNKNKHAKRFRIVIEEIDDYSKFNTVSIKTKDHEAAYYVNYRATFGNTITSATRLSDVKDTNDTDKNTYVIYEGILGAKSELRVSVVLYIDYEPLDNSFQNKAFIGTIKLYYLEDVE
jgi:hypothetical protein